MKDSKSAHTLDNESELMLCTRIKVNPRGRENNKKLQKLRCHCLQTFHATHTYIYPDGGSVFVIPLAPTFLAIWAANCNSYLPLNSQ